MIVDLLRHGELEGGIRYRGRTDDALTSAGRAAMDRVWQQLKSEVDEVITSPLSRCQIPASEWAESAGLSVQEEARVAEMFYGEWEGLTHEEIEARYPGQLQQWRHDPASMQISGAETVQALEARIAGFWSDLCKQYAEKHVLVVAHSGSMRMLLAHALAAPIATTRRLQMPYACWSRIIVKPHATFLDFHNRLP